MEYITLYNQARSGGLRIWQVATEGNKVHTRFGYLNGKLQEVVDYGMEKNVGKTNYISAEQDAQNMMTRMIREQKRQGYSEDAPVHDVGFDPFGDLPDNLSFYKPQNTLSATLLKKLNEGLAWALRKYDGEMMVIQRRLDGSVVMYSRRMLKSHHNEDIPWAERFPLIVEEARRLPVGTILLGEVTGPHDHDDRWLVAQVMKSLTPRALELQQEHGFLRYRAWDVAWYETMQLLGEVQFRFRYDVLEEISGTHILAAEAFIDSEAQDAEKLQEMAANYKWEGFVIVDPTSTYGDRGFNLRGKAERPATCGKLKPYYEDDFIAVWDPDNNAGSYGSGKYFGQLGAVNLYQYNSAGDLVYICDCGNGFSAEFIAENSKAECWPKVIQVRYESRTYISADERSNALQFPRFMAVREDKQEEECVNPLL
jgi:ATP-dependent DNA ligase/predicted DNA-binding WGR domain protein